MRGERITGGNGARREPSFLLAIGCLTAALAYAAAHSPQPVAASGIACMTGSALLASPELVEGFLRASASLRAQRIARVLSRGLRVISLLLYVTFAAAAILVCVSAQTHLARTAAVAIALAIGIAAVEGTAFMLRSLARDIFGGGEFDERVRARFGDSLRWSLAGALFLAGSVIQLIGTFFP